MLTTVRFEKVTRRVQKRGKCQSCGKTHTRATTLWQTLNPFNKNAEGFPKTRNEIYDELQTQAATWKAAPITCARS